MKHKNNWYPGNGMKAGELELKFASYNAHMKTEKPKAVYKKGKVEEEK